MVVHAMLFGPLSPVTRNRHPPPSHPPALFALDGKEMSLIAEAHDIENKSKSVLDAERLLSSMAQSAQTTKKSKSPEAALAGSKGSWTKEQDEVRPRPAARACALPHGGPACALRTRAPPVAFRRAFPPLSAGRFRLVCHRPVLNRRWPAGVDRAGERVRQQAVVDCRVAPGGAG